MICICERLSFDQLFRRSEPKRVLRARTVRGPDAKILPGQDETHYWWSAKSNPSTTGLRHKCHIKFLKPRTPIPLQDVNCEADCSCFSGDTLVLTGDGVYRPISSIRPGDFVYTHKGNKRRVLGNVERELRPGEKVYEVDVAGFPLPMTVTGSHPYYVLRGNETCRCGCGKPLTSTLFHRFHPQRILDRIFCKGHAPRPNRAPNKLIEAVLNDGSHNYRVLSQRYGISKSTASNIVNGVLKPISLLDASPDFRWETVENFRNREWVLTPWLKHDTASETTLDHRLARFLGYYASEGCISSGCVVFNVHISEESTICADLRKIVEELQRDYQDEHFHLPQQVKGVRGPLTKLTFYNDEKYARPMESVGFTCYASRKLRAFIREHVKEGSHTKSLSALMMSLDAESTRNFLIGLFLGDGHTRKDGTFRWGSVSNALVWNVSTLLLRLNIEHVITNVGGTFAVDIYRGRSAREVHNWLKPYLRNHVVARECSKIDFGSHYHQDGMIRVVNSVKVSQYSGTVWDLAVDGDESFISHGVAVANCPDFRYRWAWANKQRQASRVGPNSLNQALNRAPRVTNPGSKVGLCKHLLALRSYIYGLMSDTGGLDPIHADAQKSLERAYKKSAERWANMPGEIAKAKERDALYRADRARRAAGQDPDGVESPTLGPPGVGQLPPPPVEPTDTPEDEEDPLPPELPPREESTSTYFMANINLPSALRLVEEIENDMKQDDMSQELGKEETSDTPESEALSLLKEISSGIKELVAVGKTSETSSTPPPAPEIPSDEELNDPENAVLEPDEAMVKDAEKER